MVVGDVPGTGIRVGLSEGMYRACAAVAEAWRFAAREVLSESGEWQGLDFDAVPWQRGTPTYDEETEIEREREFRREVSSRRTSERRFAAEYAYARGQSEGVADLLDNVPLELQTEPPGLELFTDDTYLAVAPTSVYLGPFAR